MMHIDPMVRSAAAATAQVKRKSNQERADLLREIANEIEGLGDELLETASTESNLPLVRFQGERARTCGQLRMFAATIEEGSYQEPVIDTAQAERKPLPKPDLRSFLIPVGPIVVFGASNFPLAYSTAGGDTASALAAGCAVICKAHPAHPRTSEMVAGAIQRALQKCNFPPAFFSHWVARDFDEVKALVQHPLVKGVGFTGSLSGGMAIHKYAQERQEPIPVFAEMGSVNPVILLPNALVDKAAHWAETYASAITMGVGQFCTNPGLLFAIEGEALQHFVSLLSAHLLNIRDYKMLHPGIHENFVKRKEMVLGTKGVKAMAVVSASGEHTGTPVLALVDAEDFRNHATLHEEVFGPFSMVVACKDRDDLMLCLDVLQGQLTSTLIATPEDDEDVKSLLLILNEKAGRIIYNGVPTGVEVCDAMVHGGPFPATTDARFTAVGNKAIRRWLRPVAFQNCPQNLLPAILQDKNPTAAWRNINGKLTKADV